MTTQVYCTKADVEAVWTPAALLAAVDDDGNDVISTTELAIVTRAIERAANRMNAALSLRYPLTSLVENTWCRDCNAVVAAYLLAGRRGGTIAAHLQDQYETYLLDLEQIAAGKLQVPQVIEPYEHSPTVTNFQIDPRQSTAVVRRVLETSTGTAPSSSVVSHS